MAPEIVVNIGSDNGLSNYRRQAIICINDTILLIGAEEHITTYENFYI